MKIKIKLKLKHYGYISYAAGLIILFMGNLWFGFIWAGYSVLMCAALFTAVSYRIEYEKEKAVIEKEITLIAKKKIEENGGEHPGDISPISEAMEKNIKKYLRSYKNAFWANLFIGLTIMSIMMFQIFM